MSRITDLEETLKKSPSESKELIEQLNQYQDEVLSSKQSMSPDVLEALSSAKNVIEILAKRYK